VTAREVREAFTPGPWVASEPLGPSFGWAVLSPKNEMIVKYNLREADARLISAAPQLVEALREYDDAFTDFDPESAPSRHRMRLAVIKARAVLAAACGES
jgi:hypothetical protein